ncbi:MAG: tripartite tricarboxylate transporter TctB family protein [Gammaproteobacteria bacterium]|nr:tripartite tricarboxylate transporter TctB family protein [Gammaproteobacteria bacterium]
MNNDPQSKPRNILPDCIIPAIAFAFTVYYLTTITEVPWISQASAFVVSGLLMLSILAFAVRTVWRIRQHRETCQLSGAFESLLGDIPTMLKRVALLLLSIAFIWVIDNLGFTLSTFIFVFLGILLLSSVENWRNALKVSLSCAVIGYVVFIYLFNTRFPAGPIENWLKGVL